MFCPHKNSYLQLVTEVNPRVINRAVDHAMARLGDPHDAKPPTQRLTSMQPSLYAPHVDITRARLGFGRIGLRKLNRELHDKDSLVQLQALHTLLDQAQIPENAFFMINLHVVYRLTDLMLHKNPVAREKVCMILTHLACIYQGRKAILSRLLILENLMKLIVEDDKKEVRYAAAYTLTKIAKDRCSVETVVKVENIVANLLEMVKTDHLGIVLLHLKTLENIIEWDQEDAIKHNGFDIMLQLFYDDDPRIVSGVLDCMQQILKHPSGRHLGDEHDMVFVLHKLLHHPIIDVVISASGALKYATITTRSKWRAKECFSSLTQHLVELCCRFNKPTLQLNCLKVLVNLCDIPDVRAYLKSHLEQKLINLKFRTHEQWDGTSETTSYGLETGHNYRTVCIENTETIRNDYGDNALVVNVHSYLDTLYQLKEQLIKAINWKPY